MSKVVLMISRPYYPNNASGVHRSVANAKYLPFFGWTPIVVTKKYTPANSRELYDPKLACISDKCQVYRANDLENRHLKRIERILWSVFSGGSYDYRFPYLLFHRMKKVSEEILRYQRIDAIWATYMPGLDLKIADFLSRKYEIPWVADFRDLPDQSLSNRYTRYAVKQEIQICKSASALIATTDEMAKKLKSRHKKMVSTIFNGFDPDEYNVAAKSIDQGRKFTINHFGTLYRYRNPSSLLAAIDLLIDNGNIGINDFEINFYGANASIVKSFVEGHRSSCCVRIPNRLSYSVMVQLQMNSQVLLLLTSPEQAGAIPAKLYGYLAAGKPILCVPGDGAGSDRILSQTNTGKSLSDPIMIADWLKSLYAEWKCKGETSVRGHEVEIQKFSRKKQAEQLSIILENVSK